LLSPDRLPAQTLNGKGFGVQPMTKKLVVLNLVEVETSI
jgi:hypothetical protein